jgi:hypothetical protein
MSLDDNWTARIQETMSVDIARYAEAGLSGREIVSRLFDIPEVAQAFHLRARGKLGIDIDTSEGQAIAAERIEWVADFLDDGFHEQCVGKLREVWGDLSELG